MNYFVKININADVSIPKGEIAQFEYYIEKMINEMVDHHDHDSGFVPIDMTYEIQGSHDDVRDEIGRQAI